MEPEATTTSVEDIWEVVRALQKHCLVNTEQINENISAVNEMRKELKSLRGMVFLAMKKKKES